MKSVSETETKIANTKFQSPLPFIIKLRNLIFGNKTPGIYTRITFFVNLVCLLIFSLWSIISYFAIVYRQLFLEEKGVDVEAIIETRGLALGFDSGEFIKTLMTFHGISLLCWGFVFVGLILLWRRSNHFAYFFFGGTIFYFGMIIFYVGFDYYLDDISRFDKILFLLLNLNTLFYVFFIEKTGNNEKITFFG